MSLFVPGGLGVAHGHDALHRGFLKSLFVNQNWQLGQAAMSGYAAIYQAGTNIDLIYTYLILGDPALNILHTQSPLIFLPMVVR